MRRGPAATVVVVPRERFSEAKRSLESLLRNTAPPYDLVYVDGGSPAPVRRYVESAARVRDFRLVRRIRYLSPNQARNIGLSLVDTRYVVFADNDLHVWPGWLERLVACAEETGAALVAPLYHQGAPGAELIHMAGGEAAIEEREGRRYLRESHYLSAASTDEARRLERRPTQLIEFHCVLARTDVLRQMGGLDARLLSTPEHVDLCLGVQATGRGIYVEPSAKVTYVGPGPLRWYDLPYFLLRWSDEWTRSSLHHFRAKWHLADDDAFIRDHGAWMANYRRSVTYKWRSPLRRALGPRAAESLEAWLEARVIRWTTRGRDDSATDGPAR
jgi:GT2 family glycosyltransferase